MKNINIILMFVVAVLLCSCEEDFLSPAPTSAIGADSFFRNDKELETGIINMYDGIQGINSSSANDNHGIQIEYQLTEMRSDNTRTKSSEGEPAQFESFSVEPTNGVVTDYYSSFYNVVSRANLVLANIGSATEAAAPKFEGEAKFVRAYAYFNLVRLFGEIPLVESVISPSDDVAFIRRSIDDVYALITSDLSTAVANLDNTYKSRASKAAAQALLAKVKLTQGGAANYTEAKALCEAVMGSGFALVPDFKDVFYAEGNDEIIFSIGFIGDNAQDSQNFSTEMTHLGRTSGLNYVTNEAIAAFAAFGGAERTELSFRPDPVQANQWQVQKFVSDGIPGLGISSTSGDLTRAGNDWIVLRYADVLLMHVEAIMAGGATTSDPAALASFQLVRDRAGLTDVVSSISKQELMDERRVELAFENHRLFDLIRFGEAVSVLGAFATANGFTFASTDLLLPIPQRERGLSKGMLSQNPGYN